MPSTGLNLGDTKKMRALSLKGKELLKNNIKKIMLTTAWAVIGQTEMAVGDCHSPQGSAGSSHRVALW